jgi:hypothetical protein
MPCCTKAGKEGAGNFSGPPATHSSKGADMLTISPQQLILLLAVPGLLALWGSIRLKRKMKLQSRFLAETGECLEDLHNKLACLQEKDRQRPPPCSTVSQAELAARLQKSQLSAPNMHRSMTSPERYRYVHSLAANGMSSQEIASILSISIHEADQLVNLSKLAQPRWSEVPA